MNESTSQTVSVDGTTSGTAMENSGEVSVCVTLENGSTSQNVSVDGTTCAIVISNIATMMAALNIDL